MSYINIFLSTASNMQMKDHTIEKLGLSIQVKLEQPFAVYPPEQ